MVTRRKFLRQAGIVATVPAVFPRTLLRHQSKSLGVALVGLGYYSTDILAPALQKTKECHLAGIVTGSPEKIPVWQERYGIKDQNVYNYQTMGDVASNDDIDVVYIVLPTGLHAEYAIKAAEAGKHVWCEKPMAKTEAECLAMIKAASANGVKLAIGYRMQHEKNTQTIMKYAKEKPYGKIEEIKAEAGYRDGRSNHWKQNKALGGGAMYDMGVYSLNGARYAAGEEPTAVTASHSTTRPEIYHEVDETTTFRLEFPSGAIANCKTSLGESMNHLRVDCANGWYELKPFQSYSGVKGRTSDGIVLSPSPLNQQAKQMDDDSLSIKEDRAMIVPGEEGMRDIRIVEAIYRSAALGQRVTL